MGQKFIKEVNGEIGPSINLTPDKVDGLSEYINTTFPNGRAPLARTHCRRSIGPER